jgi:uncharacterized protein YbbK (DUF523 family)
MSGSILGRLSFLAPGSTYIYDGSFDGGTKKGMGVVAQILTDNGIRVFSEDQLENADRFIQQNTD